MFMLLVSALIPARIADIGSTYYSLSKSGWDLSLEGNFLLRQMISSFGFYGAAILHSAISMGVVIILAISFYYLVALLGDPRLGRAIAAAFLLSLSAISLIAAVHNMRFLSPELADIVFYYVPWITAGICFVLIFTLRVFGFGKEKIDKSKSIAP